MQNTIRYGDHQRIHIGTFGADRTGLISGSVQVHWDDEQYARPQWERLQHSAAPGPEEIGLALPCVDVKRGWEPAHSRAVYTYTYEGLFLNAEYDENAVLFEMDFSMSEDPIETHPNFDLLAKTFGWNFLKREFQHTATAQGANAAKQSGLSGQLKKVFAKVNRLYGVTSYLSVGAMFKRTYTRREIPASVLQGIGTILTKPPAGSAQFRLPVAYSKNRNWLKMAPKITKRGNAVQIADEAWLSGPRGWVEEMYSIKALMENKPDDEE